MAELTALEIKIGEVLGLAMAAQGATEKVGKLIEEEGNHGEVGHWTVVRTMNERAKLPGLQELVDWMIPIQQRHFEQTLEGSVELAADEDPNDPNDPA